MVIKVIYNQLENQIIQIRIETQRKRMEILLSMRSQTPRSKSISLFILNLFALQFISLIALNRLDRFYRKIAELILLLVDQSSSPSMVPIYAHFGLNIALIILFTSVIIFKTFKYRQGIIRFLGTIVLNFKYIFLIPVGCINIKPLINPEMDTTIKIFCAFNMVMTFILSALELYTNWSNRFLEKDYCNRRQNSILCLFFQFSFVFSTITFGNLVGSLFLIAVSIFRAYQVAITIEYSLIQTSTFFYSSLNIYICVIFLSGVKTLGFLDLSFKLIVGVFVSYYFSKHVTKLINVWYGSGTSLYKIKDKSSSQADLYNQSNKLEHENQDSINYKDIIIFSRILLSKMRSIQKSIDDPEWDLWWQKYSVLLVCHKIACNTDDCLCTNNKSDETKIIIEDMRKLMSQLEDIEKTPDVRIMEIYLNIQIANRPLKGYYEIMKMRNQQVSVTNSIDLECLTMETRECFNRLFVVNNIQNSNLPLIKIIKFQESIQTVQFQMKNLLQSNINFMELFTLSSIKIVQIISDSKKIFEIKQKINQRLEDLISNYPDSIFVNFFIFIFYQYLEVYRSKQKQLKIISQQKNLKRRLFQKEDQDIFSPQYGVIYIDLVQQRGKIKKLTKNICQLYGHNYQDMISFNINQFMPRLFAKNHYKFLSNFIEMGKIKILAQKRRILFGKNKNKFIFPLQVRLRTEHLLNNEFGVTALAKRDETGSQFIMFGANGKIQQVSQKIYKVVFMPTLKNEIDKTRRLCLIKMVPSLVRLITENNFEKDPQKIYQSLMIFTTHLDTVDKFKNHRQTKGNGSGGSSSDVSSFLSSTADLESTSNQSPVSAYGLGDTFYAQIFKSFLSQLNMVKLNVFNISYKLSRIKTQQFSLFLMEVISVQIFQTSFLSSMEEYKGIAEYLSIYEQHGNIAQNLEKFRQLFQRNDVLNFMFNKNVTTENQAKHDILKKAKYNKKINMHRKKLLTIVDNQDENKQPEDLIQDSEVQNFDDLANGLVNQQQMMPRGGSQRSSVTNQSQSQSKKQMLINAFNSKNCGVNQKFLVFVNFLMILKLTILTLLAVKSIFSIQLMHVKQLNKVLTLQFKSLHNFRLANNQIQVFFDLREQRNFTITQYQKKDQQNFKNILNQQYTKNLLLLNVLNQIAKGTFESQLMGYIELYDIQLQEIAKTSILQLLNELDFRFRSQINEETSAFFQINYLNIDNRFKQIIKIQDEDMMSGETTSNDKLVILVFGLYELMTIIVVLSWVPVFFMISKQQKRIHSLLSTMNIKQVKKAVHKLRFLWENMKLSKINQINHILAMLSDEKVEDAVELEKQKSLAKSIRLVYESGSYSIKPKQVSILIVCLLIIFSVLPLTFYMNVYSDGGNFLKTLNVIQKTYELANKAPTLVNIYLTNINKVYNQDTLVQYPPQIYAESLTDYFNLQEYISQANDLSQSLIMPNGSNQGFSDLICNEVRCHSQQSSKNIRFYDQIIEIKNKLSVLGPDKLKVNMQMNSDDVNTWSTEVEAEKTLTWISKIFLFSLKWNNLFRQTLQQSLNITTQRLIALSSILLPIYVFLMMYIQYRVIIKMRKILKDAQSVHMHFPVHVLAENTYLSSYFNDKIKNNK